MTRTDRPRRRGRLAAPLVGLLTAALLPWAAPAGAATAGSAGVGDPYFPRAGNGGIDVRRYDLRLDYTPPAPGARLVGRLVGDARISLRATRALTSFHLDLRRLRASSVRVDGQPARFRQAGGELVVTPARALATGERAVVRVRYAGRTGRPQDSTGALYGWVTTSDGAVVANEPDGASTWFPANDHPTDKATYRFSVRVPRGTTAVANGLLESRRSTRGHTTWVWDATDPMASYLATATVGDFDLRRSSASGVPIVDAVDRDLPAGADDGLERTGDMLALFSDLLGPYPFVAYGGIVDDDPLGYALETQTRSLFTGSADEITAAHELAHQWLGDDVGPARWSDIWLNEGWATYLEWTWSGHVGEATPQESYEAVMSRPANDDFWKTVVADPGRDEMFSEPVYLRGGAALHALRRRVGDDTFWRIARAWVSTYAGRTASTADFVQLASRVSGEDLTGFFDTWVRRGLKPAG